MQKDCEYCRKRFDGRRSNRKYCSDNCKQMAYYRRNGLMPAGFSGNATSDADEKALKYFSTSLNDQLLNVLADRLLILLEERLAGKVAGNAETTEATELEDRLTVKPYFTVSDLTDDKVCNFQPYQGFSSSVDCIIVKDGFTETQENGAQSGDAVEDKEKPTARRRERKRTIIEYIPLQDEEPQHQPTEIPTTEINEAQLAEMEQALLNFTVSGDDDVASGTMPIEEPYENSPHSPVGTKSENVKYEWVNSLFIRHIEDYICRDYTDLSQFTRRKEYTKTLECIKCLLWTLVQLSNRARISHDMFTKVTTAFSLLIQSSTFSRLPKNFPYYSLVVSLKGKLCSAAESNMINAIRLSVKQKATLIAIRYQMGKSVRDIKFSDLF